MATDTNTHKMPIRHLTIRPWRGPCATTDIDLEEYAKRLHGTAELPDWMTQAAVSIVRSYGIRGICDPGYIAHVIESAFKAAQSDLWTQPTGDIEYTNDHF